MSAWVYVLYMCDMMWDCKFGYNGVMCYGYTGYACIVCVIWYDDLRLIYTCVIWSQMELYIRILWEAAWLEFFVCSFEYYILWINYEHNMYDLCTLYGWIVNI